MHYEVFLWHERVLFRGLGCRMCAFFGTVLIFSARVLNQGIKSSLFICNYIGFN